MSNASTEHNEGILRKLFTTMSRPAKTFDEQTEGVDVRDTSDPRVKKF